VKFYRVRGLKVTLPAQRTLEFANIRANALGNEVSEHDDIFADMLRALFTRETGLETYRETQGEASCGSRLIFVQ